MEKNIDIFLVAILYYIYKSIILGAGMGNHKYNFPEELLYENIAKEMDGKENFISNRGSVFPHGNLNNVDFNSQLPPPNTSNEDLEKYLANLPHSFDEWTH